MAESSDPHRSRQEHRSGTGISLSTLIVASVASAAASFAVSRIWGPGTVIGAAVAPVIVAVVSEFLRRPVQTITDTAKSVPTTQVIAVVRDRRLAMPGGQTRQEPTSHTADQEAQAKSSPAAEPRADVRSELPTPAGAESATVPPAQTNTWHPRWRLVAVTAMLAFAIVVGVFTVPEVLAGRAITGNGQATTFFGGSSSVKTKSGQETGGTRTTGSPATTTAPTGSIRRTATATTARATKPGPASTRTTTTTTTLATSTRPAAASATSTTPRKAGP